MPALFSKSEGSVLRFTLADGASGNIREIHSPGFGRRAHDIRSAMRIEEGLLRIDFEGYLNPDART